MSNAAVLTHLLLKERASLMRLAQRILGNGAAAEDVTQSLWLRIQRVDDQPPIINKRAYLYRLASNLAIDHARSETRRTAVQAQAAELLAGTEDIASGEGASIARDDLRRIADALAVLPPQTRRMFMLSRIDGFSQRDIAAQLGVSRPTVEKHLRRAFDAVLAACDVPA